MGKLNNKPNKSCTILEMLESIDSKKILLPSMQRKFVWSEEKIIKLFDSIMRGYPFGNFLFWHIEDKSHLKQYHFYEFIKDFSFLDHTINPIAGTIGKSQIDVVMDGQQRLTSLYIGIKGSLVTIDKYKKKEKSQNWKTKHLYIKPYIEQDRDNEVSYKFEFLEDKDANKNNSEKSDAEKYYRVSEFYNLTQEQLYQELDVKRIRTKEDNWKYNLERLRKCINDVKIISIHSIENTNINDVLEIFTRINNGGTPLSPSNLLFSTVITNWEKGREEMDSFITSINKENVITIKEDFLIRACLYLNNKPASAQISILNTSVVEEIKSNWDRIKNAIFQTKDFLYENNIYDEAIISYNAILPIAYYFYHTKRKKQDESKKNLFTFFIIAQLFSIFGGHSDSMLENVREKMCKTDEKGKMLGDLIEPFDIKNLLTIKLSNGTSAFGIKRQQIENLVDTVGYGHKKSKILLCFLQPGIVLHKKNGTYYDEDHVCSQKEVNAQAAYKDDSIKNVICEKRDLISNLQLLEEGKNRGDKKDATLYKWKIEKHNSIPFDPFENETDLDKYVIDSIEKFYEFYEARRKMIIDYLCECFGVEK